MNKRKLILSAMQLFLIALCLSLVTVAWFSNNKRIKTSNIGMTIQPVSDVATLSCYALRYDGTYGAICYKIGDDAENGEVLDVEMTEFDRIFRDRSVNTPLIYAVELANVPDTAGYYITIKVPCSAKFVLPTGGTATNNYDSSSSENGFVIQRYISNIVSVKVACGGQITMPTPTTTQRVQNNVNVFQAQQTVFRSITSGDAVGQFATVSGTVYSKETSVRVRLSQSDYHDKLYDATDDEGVTSKHLMLYIQFDYDQALMDAFIEHMMDDSEGDVAFADDLGLIQMLVGTGGN